MKISESMVFHVVKMASPILAAVLICACSEEKSEPLPDLPAIELPKEFTGLYSGSMPCDDCTARMIRMNLNEDSTASVVQTLVRENMLVDTLKGSYAVSADSVIKVTLVSANGDNVHWNYKRSKSGNLTYLNSAGSIYEDRDGNKFDLIRILKAPVVKKVLADSSVNKE
ncbi:MAG: copper resistance protein NlpE [Fibrobacter sp.]|nr:copper resistance protein NlpE [Fibrobacter sp.]